MPPKRGVQSKRGGQSAATAHSPFVPAQPSYTNTKKWINPDVLAQQEEVKKIKFRRTFCPKSYAWPPGLKPQDIEDQYSEEEKKVKVRKKAREQATEEFRASQTWFPEVDGIVPPEEHLKPVEVLAFNGKDFFTNHSAVLSLPTIFSPSYELSRDQPLADWPSKEERQYEGDERIATDTLHGRYLGLPRVPGNDTVNWMQRSYISQYPFDDFYYGYATEWNENFPRSQAALQFPVLRMKNEMDIWWRNHFVAEHQIDDETGVELLGAELMDVLDD